MYVRIFSLRTYLKVPTLTLFICHTHKKNMHIPDGNADLMSLRNGMTKYDLFFKVECFSMNIIVEVKKRKEA